MTSAYQLNLIFATLNRVPSDDDLWEIAKELHVPDGWEDLGQGRDWSSLGKDLGLNAESLLDIKESAKDPQRMTYLHLSEWKDNSHSKKPCTFETLHQVLRERGGKDVADEIFEHICKKKCDEVKTSI